MTEQNGDGGLIDLQLLEHAPRDRKTLREHDELCAVVLEGELRVAVNGVALGTAGRHGDVFEAPGDAVYVPLDHDGDVVSIRAGYHPVVAAPGYALYYLWVMAGAGRQLAPFFDPQHAWVQERPTRRTPL